MKKLSFLLLLGSLSFVMADGAALFKKCQSCHGAKGEKVALGKSKVINQMSKQELIDSMSGYLNGTYGGTMKVMMKNQLNGYSKDDISAVAEYITTLK